VTLVIDLCLRDLSRTEFVQPIARIVGQGARVKGFLDMGPEEVEAEDSVVICGTALADDDYLDDLEPFGWLRDTETPVLGICAGMQVIGLLHGARLVPGKEIGMTRVEPVGANPLVDAPMEAYGLHKYGLADLEEFRVLARSEGSVQAIVHRERPLYGVMFHPEVRRGNVVSRFLGIHGDRSGQTSP
jgi:GMP synthase-like glutamine amidotransferase